MARLDTGWHAHPKILRLTPVGMALHAWSISYCDYTRSDGFIPDGAWPAKLSRGVAELDGARLYEPVEGGYQLHDYTDWNRSKAQIAAEQADDRDRKTGRKNGRIPAGIPPESGDDSSGIPRAPGPGPGDDERVALKSSLPNPYPFPNGAAPDEPSARRAPPLPTSSAQDAITTMYGPRQQVERLPNGAQQCPLCPEIFTCSYSEHLDSPRHKIRPEPEDLSGFRG